MSSTDLSGGPTSHALYDAVRKRRATKRRTKKNENEISYLNITPMLDMMTIILVFLLKSFASSATNVNVANLVLPHSTTELNVEEAIQLMITPEAILVDQKVVTPLEGGVIPTDMVSDGYLVNDLYDVLANEATKLKKIEEFGGAQFSGKIAVIADKNTTYQTIFKILYTAGRAEFGLFKLFVQKPA